MSISNLRNADNKDIFEIVDDEDMAEAVIRAMNGAYENGR